MSREKAEPPRMMPAWYEKAIREAFMEDRLAAHIRLKAAWHWWEHVLHFLLAPRCPACLEQKRRERAR